MWPPAHLTTTNMALNMMQQNMIVESLITNLASITWSETSPVTCLLIKNLTLPPSPGVIRTLASLARVITNLALFDWSSHTMIRNFPHVWSLDINRTFAITWSTRTEDAVLQLWSYFDYHAVFSTVWHSQDQLLSPVWWQSLETILVNKFIASWSAPMLLTSSDHFPFHPVCVCVSLKMWSLMLLLWLDELLLELRPSLWLDKILMNSQADQN